ncbi:MAG: biopolymer transporter ExbD [Spongiibacteraceae bacterium]|jgi:biopolymer transport protein ExbD|nr:biopolymer transporter ExbD [Spongiibacteraceae bacterium]
MSKLRLRRSPEEETEIDLTPMLDVVFIMLIFFIVTASFIKEITLPVNMPESTEAPKNQKNPNIVVKVTATDEIWMEDRRVDRRAVRSVIERLYAENPKAAVIVSASPESTTDAVSAVIDSAREANVYNVSLVLQEGKR